MPDQATTDLSASPLVARRWETSTRYYESRIYVDIFGDLVLEKIWGSLSSRRGGHHVVAVGGDDCLRSLRIIERERAQRGYRDCSVSREIGSETSAPHPQL